MSGSLRICMVTTFYPPYHFGGDGVYVQRLATELAQRGHHVEVIHNADAYLALTGREPAAGSNGVDSSVIVHPLRSRNPLLSALFMQQTGTPGPHATRIRRILSQGFDVIHYHNVSLVGGPQILQYGEGLKLYTLHEYWLVCPTHVLFRFNQAACTRRDCLMCQLIYRRPPQLWRYTSLLNRASRHVHAFLAPSRFAVEKHHQYGFHGSMRHLPHFVPSTELAPPSPRPHPRYFLFVGRLEKLKGVHTLIPVFRRYRKAQLWIAGRGSDEQRLRRAAGNCDNIRFLGFVGRAKLDMLYRQACAVVMPSLCYEISPLVVPEAAQHQTPVIVRNLGALPEFAEESSAGLCYDTEDELLAIMDRLISDPAYRDELGQRGRYVYLRHWTPQAHLQTYLRLIADLQQGQALRRTS